MVPDQFTLKETVLPVGDSHQLYVQLWGNNRAKNTILYLHGGPGSGCSDSAKKLFDPKSQKVIFFDQRGCGRSLPYGSLQNNTINNLVADINKILNAFGLKKVIICGGSWGSCLALVYAIRNSDKVKAMVLRGIFTARKIEVDFVDNGGLKFTYPDAWARYVLGVLKKDRESPTDYHVAQILMGDRAGVKKSAYAYSQLEAAIGSLEGPAPVESFKDFDSTRMIIHMHYLANDCFLPEGYILRNAGRLKVPVALVQGRYDMICPPFTAFELSQKLPNCKLIWTIAGHSAQDSANLQAVRSALSEQIGS